jgi:hypothetical protein
MREINSELARKVFVSVISLAIILSMSATIGKGGLTETRTEERVLIFGCSSAVLEKTGIDVIEEYNNFILAEVTLEQKAVLKSNGIDTQPMKHLTTIGLQRGAFDTRDEGAYLSTDLRIDSYPAEIKGYYIVQFIGPIKEKWKIEIENADAEINGYVPYNAFIVKMDESTKRAVENLRYVQWVGIYQPAYKIATDLTEMSDDQATVTILTHNRQDLTLVIEKLKELGVDIIGSTDTEDYGIIRASVSPSTLSSVANIEEVSWIEKYEQPELMNYIAQWVIQTNTPDVRSIWDHGIKGDGQIVSWSDSGCDWDHDMFRNGAINNDPPGPNHRKIIEYYQWMEFEGSNNDTPHIPLFTIGHGTHTGCALAGCDDPIGGTPPYDICDGMAKNAKMVMVDIGDINDYLQLPLNWDVIFQRPYELGARVQSNSWGTLRGAPKYGYNCMMTDRFMWEHKDFLILFAAGNSMPGDDKVAIPASAKNLVSVGASDEDNNDLWWHSCNGPTTDGRLAPTVIAPSKVYSAKSDGDLTTKNSGYMQKQGTSASCPVTAGGAALIRQYFTDGWYPSGNEIPENGFSPSAALMKAMLINSAVEINGANSDKLGEGVYPNNAQGYGRILLENCLYFDGDTSKLNVWDNTEGLFTGESKEYTFFVSDISQSLEITLVWTDYYAEPAANPALVNDLNLQVTSPSGKIYYGNNYQGIAPGHSVDITISNKVDDRNVTESVILLPSDLVGEIGQWEVSIIGANVPVSIQPFALVVTGGLDNTYGRITLDKVEYGEIDTINIRVEDLDVSAITVDITSTTETTPETVTLTEVTLGSGVWVGSINTEFNDVEIDGVLQVHDGDIITATYYSDSATATVQAAGRPVVTSVFVRDILNTMVNVTWNTDIKSNSRVYYGTDASLGLVAEHQDLTMLTSHFVILENLIPDTIYYFDVESTDKAGHVTRDNNGGSHYTFKTMRNPEVFLVIDDQCNWSQSYDGLGRPNNFELQYESSLEAKGWSFIKWDTTFKGTPTLSEMQSGKVVVWASIDRGLENTREAIAEYLDSDGRLFYTPHRCGHHYTHWEVTGYDKAWYEKYMRATLENKDSLCGGVDGKPNYNNYDGTGTSAITGINSNLISDGWFGSDCELTDRFREIDWEDRGQMYPEAIIANNSEVAWKYRNGNDGAIMYDHQVPSLQYKLVYEAFAHEFIGEDLDPDPIRTDILDKSIQWLLGPSDGTNDHPDVTVLPLTGLNGVSGQTTISWEATDDGTITNINIFFSNDTGQTWYEINDGVYDHSNDGSEVWNTLLCENGPKYLIKIIATDDGNPALTGEDVLSDTFTVDNGVDYDNQPPVVVPGSIKVTPNPTDGQTFVTLTATLDDSNKGDSTITAAEWSDGGWLSYPGWCSMYPVDGIWDEPIETVKQRISTWGLETATIRLYVRSKDTSGNWSPGDQYVDLKVTQLPPDIPPEPPIADAGPDQSVFDGDTVTFWDHDNSYDPDGYIVDWTWEFGDGDVGYGQITTHVYDVPHQYGAFLEVTDNVGLKNYDRAEIWVWESGHDLEVESISTPQTARLGQTKTITVWIKNIGTYDDYGLLSLTVTAPDESETTMTKIVRDKDGTSLDINGRVKVVFSVTFNQVGDWYFHAHVDVSDSNGNINPFPRRDQDTENNDGDPGYPTEVS